MEEKLISLMLDKNVYEIAKDYCHRKNLKVKHFIREAIIESLVSRGIKKGLNEKNKK